jgi:hypothetical protein
MAKCKYPNEVCANMTILNGSAYCDSIPCSLKNELPKQTNADRIRSMNDEELAKFIRAVECCSRYSADCGFPFCPSMEGNLCNGIKEKTYQYILDWLQSEVKGSGI